MIFKTLRWRVQRGHALFMILIFPILLGIPYYLLRLERIQSTDRSLAIAIAHTSTRQLITNDSEFRDIFVQPKWYRIYDKWGDVMHESSNAPELTITYDELNFDQFAWIEEHRTLAIRRQSHGRAVLVGIPKDVLLEGMTAYAIKIGFIILGIEIFALAMGWWTAGKSLSPIARMTEVARRINHSKEFEEIDLSDTEHELRDLGEVLNDAFKRLHYALKKQRDLTADVSHELRTPISIILLELESALRKERNPEEYIERLQSCLETTDHLKQLVDSLLILARSDADFTQIETVPSSLKQACEETAQLLAPKAQALKATIHTDCEEVTLSIDPERMKQVMINLINNAMQYGGPGTQVTLQLRTTKDAALLSVIDNGPGISPEDQQRIFDRFYRKDKARDSKQGNLGLGLSICKTIVDAHHGEITIIPTGTPGTHFQVSLPLATTH